ncbi:MAG: hypothetical protein HND48_06040 [Chloroflexi bacterium]|nr:hypothetical protein [Chloroflexota bacterium]
MVLPPDSADITLDQPLDPALFTGNEARLVSDSGRERVYAVDPDGDALLFVSETYAAGWKAFVRP